MRAVFAPLTSRVAPHTVQLVGSVCFASALIFCMATPGSRGSNLTPGDVVNYSEDQLGRPWRILRKYEFRRFVIRNGRVTAIAEAHELSPHDGYANDEISLEKAGLPWKELVADLESKHH